MQPLAETITAIVHRRPGITTVELAHAIYGRREQPLVNGECLHMANGGRLIRVPGDDGVIRNYLPDQISN